MSKRKIDRRTFLQAAGAAGIAASLPSAMAAQGGANAARHEYPENGTLVPDDGWRLWIDEKAAWRDDAIHLPEEVRLETLPTNPPTGDWDALTAEAGIEVTLPTTVEQHFWGKFGQRPYTPDEYRYAADDPVPQNGAFEGVSWWHRQIDIPAAMRGKRIFLHIRGARMRAEVYLNRKLVGYSIMEELPFECELTAAANAGGANHLAIRITNPGGRYDWVDGGTIQWGKVKVYRSHGFGGIDRGITISASQGGVRIRDMWALNTPNPKEIAAFVEVEFDDRFEDGNMEVEILDPRTGAVLKKDSIAWMSGGAASGKTSAESAKAAKEDRGGKPRLFNIQAFKLPCPAAELWTLEKPVLYHLRATLGTAKGSRDSRTIAFGFRWFAPDGLGANALFRLNGQRIKLYSSISWGFWGLNGLFPTPELAEQEVAQAKKLNLNCLNFHRNVGKEEVFRRHDELGLLRYMEPGGGKLAIGRLPSGVTTDANSIVMQKPTSDADLFSQKFMVAKFVAMVKAFRSHPSLIQYTLQNEIGADLANPDTLAVLAAMRAQDPSRIIALNDGFVAPPRRAAQAWYEPYNDKLHRTDQEPWGGWWNQHQGAGDQWYDDFYKSPTDFTYYQPLRPQLVEFGEMEGCAVPDNHSLMVHQIGQRGGKSYDLADHQEIIAAYEKFISRWGFRKAFPTAEQVFLAVGRKQYESWQQYMENARICDELDFAVISGWESTAIENHSGIVDNLRNFKSDPRLISQTLRKLRPVAKQRHLAVAMGESAVFDLYLLNDSNRPATGTLVFSVVDPSGKSTQLATFPAPAFEKDRFAWLLKEAFATAPLMVEGLHRFKFALSTDPLAAQTREIWVVDAKPRVATKLRIGVAGISAALRKRIEELGSHTVEDFAAGEKHDLLIASGLTAQATGKLGKVGDETGLEAQPPAGAAPRAEAQGRLPDALLEAAKAGTPLLVVAQTDALADGVAKQLAAAGAFAYNGQVGDTRAPWMGNWYFLREHPVYAGLPVNQGMGAFYQARGKASNGLLVEGAGVDVFVGYSRDHDRSIGAGTFSANLGAGKLLFQRVPQMAEPFEQRWLANAVAWLTRS